MPRHRAGPQLDDSFAMAENVLGPARTSVVVTRAADDNPIVWVNDSFVELTGYSRDEVLGRNPRFLQGSHTDRRAVRQVHRALALGGTAATTLINYRKDGTPFWNRMVIVPIRDGRGEITHHVAVHSDATVDVVDERADAASAELNDGHVDRMTLLTQVIDALTQHLDYHAAADAMIQTVVAELADWGFIFLLDENGHVEHLSLATADPAKRPAVERLAAHDHAWYEHSPQMLAALKAQPGDLLMPRTIDADWVASNVSPDHVALHRELGMGSSLVVPLLTRDQPLGVMGLLAADPDRFTVSSALTMAPIGRRAGLALDHIRLYRAERSTALTLQHRLAPSAMDTPDLDVAAAYRPSGRRAEVGGDWYDVFPLREHGIMLAVGDVVGHDMSAAAAMGHLSVLLRARGWTGDPPGLMLRGMVDMLDAMHWDDVASVVCLRWTPTADGDRVEYANLGHPAPFVRLPDGDVYQMSPAHGAPLGVHDPAADVGQDELDLPAGSVVVLYTDGLVERRDRSLEDGLAALARALRAAPDGTAAQIRDHLLAALVHDRPEDDVCLLVVRGLHTQTQAAHLPHHGLVPLLSLDAVGKVVHA